MTFDIHHASIFLAVALGVATFVQAVMYAFDRDLKRHTDAQYCWLVLTFIAALAAGTIAAGLAV